MTTTAADTSGEAWASGARGSGTTAARAQLAGLFDEHGRLVLGVCRTLLRNSHDAEDAAQQTFLSAYRSLLGGGVPRQPDAWLAAIARNECRGHLRRRMREPLPEAEVEGESPDPVPAMIRSKALWDAISGLPSQQRRALLLRELGLSYEELATALAVSEPAVESLLFRARHHLRGALASVNGLFSIAAIRELLFRATPGTGVATSQAAAKLAALPLLAKVAAGAATVALVAGGTVVVAPLSHRPRSVAQAATAKTPVRAIVPTRATPRQTAVTVPRPRIHAARPHLRVLPASTIAVVVRAPTPIPHDRPAVTPTPDPAPSQPTLAPASEPAPSAPAPAAPAPASAAPASPAAVVIPAPVDASPAPGDSRTVAHHDDPGAAPPDPAEADPTPPADPSQPDPIDPSDPPPPPHDPLPPADSPPAGP